MSFLKQISQFDLVLRRLKINLIYGFVLLTFTSVVGCDADSSPKSLRSVLGDTMHEEGHRLSEKHAKAIIDFVACVPTSVSDLEHYLGAPSVGTGGVFIYRMDRHLELHLITDDYRFNRLIIEAHLLDVDSSHVGTETNASYREARAIYSSRLPLAADGE